MTKEYNSYAFLDNFRGKDFSGQWPTLVELFKITVKRYPERPCFTIYEPERISLSYTEALAKIEAAARWLCARGVKKGDRVAVTGKNAPEWTVAYLGVLFAGGIVVPIDAQLHLEECAKLIKTSGAKIIFADEEKHNKFLEGGFGLDAVVSLSRGIGLYIYDIDGPPEKSEQPAEQDLAAILFTSGTTGEPKGVMLTHQNLTADCYLAQNTPLRLYETDKFYAILPIHHAYCMLAVFIEAISVGAEVVFGKRLVVQNMLRDLREAKITMLLGVPMLFNKLLNGIMRGLREKGALVYGLITFLMGVSGIIKKVFGVNPGKKMFAAVLSKASLSSVRICICGGGPLSPSVFRKFNQLGIDFVQGYGLTETSPIINLNPIEHYKETSVGKTVPGAQQKVLNPDERGIGEIAVRGPMVMKGYYNMPEETAKILSPEGWLNTGDLGYLDGENYLYLTGRAKNVIVTEGGKNVFPEEIENEFQLFEEIDQVLVRGYVPNKSTKNEHIEALVYPNQDYWKDNDASAVKTRVEEIVAEVNKRLLPYARIERTGILTERMEETTTKKIKRETLKG